MESKDIINVAIEAAKEAGDFLALNFGKISRIEAKGDRNLVTNLDKEAEGIILSKIKEKFPGHGIIAEETKREEHSSDYTWIIDPLDGTHNYIHNVKIYAVSIGILYKEEFVGGVIFAPEENELYVGEKGSGSYKNNKKITVSHKLGLKECFMAFDSSIRYCPERMLSTLREVVDKVFSIRMLGSSARVLSYIAEGNMDGTIEFYDAPWDFAGGVCILQEAGGMITDLEGKPVTKETAGYVASNGLIHEKLLNMIRR